MSANNAKVQNHTGEKEFCNVFTGEGEQNSSSDCNVQVEAL